MADPDDIFRVTPRSFKDVGINFSKNPLTNDVIAVKDESAVTQSIKNLIMDNDSAIIVTLTYRIIGEPQIINNKFLLERPVS